MVRRERRRRYGKLRVYAPEEYRGLLDRLGEQHPGMVVPCLYASLENIDLTSLYRNPSAVVVKEQNKRKLAKISSESAHIFQLVGYPSENAHLLKNGRVSMLAR